MSLIGSFISFQRMNTGKKKLGIAGMNAQLFNIVWNKSIGVFIDDSKFLTNVPE